MPSIALLRPGLWLVGAYAEDFDVRGAVVAGAVRAVVWDTLARPRDMEGVAELVDGLPFTVVYSHGDWDHVWGTGGLSRSCEEIVAHETCGIRFRDEVPGALAEKRASEPGPYDEVTLRPPTRTFRGRLTLELGGVELELHSLPGHTPDTIVGYIPQWNILLGGDAVENPLPFLNPGSRVEEWARDLERWADRLEEGGGAPEDGASSEASPGLRRSSKEPDGETLPSPLLIPAHGPLAGPGLLRANARYLRELAAGREPDLPPGLAPFYRDTHAANRTVARGEGGG
jgi:glyoxylase-like metal-dependent hydrolase (beta-lactamase superfamily II)